MAYSMNYNIGENITRRVTKKELLDMIERMYGRGDENSVIAIITETRTRDPYSDNVYKNQSVTFALPFSIT